MLKKCLIVVISIFSLSLSSLAQSENCVPLPDEKTPSFISRAITADLLERDDFMMYISDHYKGIHYAEICAAFGAARIAGLQMDSSLIRLIVERYKPFLKIDPDTLAKHVDAYLLGILPLELYLHTGKTDFLDLGLSLAENQWKDTIQGGLTSQTRYWIDDIWMIGSLQVQAFRATGNGIYLDRAALETASYITKLQQPDGLFNHGPDGPFSWGRGNGWTASGMAELLSELSPDHPLYEVICSGYKKMMDTLVYYQSEDGMWRQLIDVDSSWRETSATAMFGYALAVGVKKGILKGEKYNNAFKKAWFSLTDYVGKDGRLTEVCAGTGQSTDINYYLDRPRITGDFHGQAPMLWLAYELMLEKSH